MAGSRLWVLPIVLPVRPARFLAHHGAARGQAGEGQNARRDLENARAQRFGRFAPQTVLGQLMIHAIGIFGDVGEPNAQLARARDNPWARTDAASVQSRKACARICSACGRNRLFATPIAVPPPCRKRPAQTRLQPFGQDMSVIAHGKRTVSAACGASVRGPAHKAARPAPDSTANRCPCANPRPRTAPAARHWRRW